MNWYYGINEQQFGPVNIEELKNLTSEGTIGPRDLVWNPSFGEKWEEAQTVSELTFPSSLSHPIVPPAGAVSSGIATTAHIPPQEPAGLLENKEVTRRARVSLSGNWGLCIGATIIYVVISQLVTFIPIIGGLLSFFIAAPLVVGLSSIYLNIIRGFNAEVSQLFDGFKVFGLALGTYFLTTLFTFLWMLLLIVPGIIASISYSMVYFIIIDNPGIGAMDAIRLSKEMMRGYKWQYFCLGFRFLGWVLLSILTFGIALLWVGAYMQTSFAHFYEMVRRNYTSGPITAS